MVMGSLKEEAELAIVGAGPGGYVAALRAADLGLDVVLIEERERPGGVCLLEGCIPSKALISAVDVIRQARDAERFGFTFENLNVDREKLYAFRDEVVKGLTDGVGQLLKARGVEVIRARARLDGKNSLKLSGSDTGGIDFKHLILATGSRVGLPDFAKDVDGIWTSREALAMPRIPKKMVVVGGGYIGLELGQVYAGLGTDITVMEFMPRFLPGADADLAKVVEKRCKGMFADIHTGSKVRSIEKDGDTFVVRAEHEGEDIDIQADAVLVAVGRKPNVEDIGLDEVGIEMTDSGCIKTDESCRTSIENIFAIGDITEGPMLAHKASREGKVAAEVIANEPSAFDNRGIPAVVFTDPELAWVGLTEDEAKDKGQEVTVGRFPLRALGRARTLGQTDGMVKIIADKETDRVLGVGMVGPHVSEIISEATLALELGARLEDMMVSIHPHPTISEALMEAAEVATGHPVHIVPKRKKGKK